MADPRIPQGSLNKLKASVIWANHPQLNITPSFLGPDGIALGFEGDAAIQLPSMTGTVPSPEPYQMLSLTINLLRTQYLAELYKQRMEFDARIGDGTVRPDVSTGTGGIGLYQITNAVILGVNPLSFAGRDAGF